MKFLSGMITVVFFCVSLALSAGFAHGQNNSPAPVPSAANPAAGLVGAWELAFKVLRGGVEEPVKADSHTLMEFADDGQVMVTKTHKDNPDKPDAQPGKFAVEDGQIVIVDESGNTARCPYRLDGDKLVITVPQVGKDFHWRRVK